MLTKQLRELERQAEELEKLPKKMQRKASASIMTKTEKMHQKFWESPKNELASKIFLKARNVYKQNLKK